MSEPIERFSNWCAVSHGHEMALSEGGLWVRYSDYAALSAQVAELQRAVRGLLSHDFADQCQECGIGKSEAWKTAIDAAKESGNE